MNYNIFCAVLALSLGTISSLSADTTDQKWMTIIELEKQGEHCADDPNCFNRYHPEVPEKATANIGDMIVYHTRDALDTKFTLDSIPADLATVDLGLVHPMTGPVHINGAQRGDAIEVEIVDIVPDQYGYTVIAPGFGFLRDIFTEPHIVNWRLTRTGAVSPQMPGITVPYEAFPGSIGVMPGMPEVEKIKAREAGLAAVGVALWFIVTSQPVIALIQGAAIKPHRHCDTSGLHINQRSTARI
mgnify:CR=1 FL=1